jgi:hypothetical protein
MGRETRQSDSEAEAREEASELRSDWQAEARPTKAGYRFRIYRSTVLSTAWFAYSSSTRTAMVCSPGPASRSST